jgi:hypothetical protein
MSGAANEALMANTVAMSVTVQSVMDKLIVEVTLTNTGAGHHVPTDQPGRQMILTITALDDTEQPLAQIDGSIVPAWGGPQAGLPGKAFAKVLRDAVSGELPVVSYWKRTSIASDNRLPALGMDRSTYTFRLTNRGGAMRVLAELRFRRNLWDLMEARGWQEPDILMETEQLEVFTQPWYPYFLPLLQKN